MVSFHRRRSRTWAGRTGAGVGGVTGGSWGVVGAALGVGSGPGVRVIAIVGVGVTSGAGFGLRVEVDDGSWVSA